MVMAFPPKLAFLFAIQLIHLSALAFVVQSTSDDDELGKLYELCPSNTTFAPNSIYGLNLNDLFTSLALSEANTQIENGFISVSYGENPDQVNALGLCRGDVNPDVCRSCIYEAIIELSEFCSDQTEGIVWYDECMFRYSNRSILGKMEFQPSHHLITADNVSVSKPTKHEEVLLETLLDNLKNRAASDNSLRKFATGNASGFRGQSIYALAQCTPDLSEAACEDCLSRAAESLSRGGVEAARFMTPSCSIRYDNYMFYGSSVDLPPVNLSPASPPSDAPALPPDTPTPSPSVAAPPSSPPVDEPPTPPFYDEPLPPEYFDEPPPLPPLEFDAPPPPSPVPAPEPPVELPDVDIDTGKGNMNNRFQALTTVAPLVILLLFAFQSLF